MDGAGVDKAGLIASVAAAGVGGAIDPIHVDEVKAVIDEAPRPALRVGGDKPAHHNGDTGVYPVRR